MNKQQLAEELSDFTFEIARLADECDISKGDLAILELCHRELDRISEDLMEEGAGEPRTRAAPSR